MLIFNEFYIDGCYSIFTEKRILASKASKHSHLRITIHSFSDRYMLLS